MLCGVVTFRLCEHSVATLSMVGRMYISGGLVGYQSGVVIWWSCTASEKLGELDLRS